MRVGISKRTTIAACLCALALTLGGASSAQAGGYTAAQCDQGIQGAAPEARLLESTTGYITSSSGCPNSYSADSYGLTIQEPAAGFPGTLGAFAQWIISVPGGLRITGADFDYFLRSGSRQLAEFYFAGGASGTLTWGPHIAPPYAAVNAYREHPVFLGLDATVFGIMLRCPFVVCNQTSGTGYASAKNIHLRLSDVAVPVQRIEGSLRYPGSRAGIERLAIEADDAGSGVRSTRVLVNGVEVDREEGGCTDSFGGVVPGLTPCPRSRDFELELDTGRPPWLEGSGNAVEVCTADFALTGTANEDCDRFAVEVDNPPLNGEPGGANGAPGANGGPAANGSGAAGAASASVSVVVRVTKKCKKRRKPRRVKCVKRKRKTRR